MFNDIDDVATLHVMSKHYLLLMIDSLKKENSRLRMDNQRLKILFEQEQSKKLLTG